MLNTLKINLTKREKEIIRLVAEDHSSKLIANILYISVHTVNTHKKNIKQKLDKHSFYGVISFAFKNNIIPINTEEQSNQISSISKIS